MKQGFKCILLVGKSHGVTLLFNFWPHIGLAVVGGRSYSLPPLVKNHHHHNKQNKAKPKKPPLISCLHIEVLPKTI